jgi:hypothetical protein
VKLELLRVILTPLCSVGVLRIDGKHHSFTMEDTVRAPGVKVPGKTAIPATTYTVEITHSPRFSKLLGRDVELPLIWNVEKDGAKYIEHEGVRFDGVRFHALNTAEQSDGCVGPGRHVLETGADEFKVTESTAAMSDLLRILDGARQRQEHVGLVITNT